MTTAAKMAMIKTILRIDDTEEDALIATYLDAAAREIIAWRFSNAGNAPEIVPQEYEITQVQAVVNGYTQAGTEGQTTATENGITRRFEYSDMLDYIRGHVIPVAGTV